MPRLASPRTLIADIKAFLAARGQHRIIAATLALIIPTILFTGILLHFGNRKAPVQVVRVHMWSADRTEAEIVADQKKAQAGKEARAKERQSQFQKLADMLGI